MAVDHNMKFRYLTFGYGSSHDSRVYRSSPLRKYIEELNGYHAIADKAFSSFTNIMTPIRTENTDEDRKFNKNLGLQRVIVENAFGLFKGKFKIFFVPIINGEK
ncbi:hypothetical protein DMUE_3604 [Dictyocoela muelleri]|nr:hypothetical protein DMUE_3604 [Dictyocoela muelleri]